MEYTRDHVGASCGEFSQEQRCPTEREHGVHPPYSPRGGRVGGRCLMVGDWSGVQLLQLRGINTIIINVIFRTTQATADSPGPCKPSRPGEPAGEYLPHKTFILA
ncbi:unnamed protein product [Arctogadus glacialis]